MTGLSFLREVLTVLVKCEVAEDRNRMGECSKTFPGVGLVEFLWVHTLANYTFFQNIAQ